jgi:hypothetical protein
VHIFKHRRDELGPHTAAIEIVIPQNHRTARRLAPLLGDPKRPRVPTVQVSRGRWRKASAILITNRTFRIA